MDPLCVLDFYVEESFQRHGIGFALFNCLLQNEQVQAFELAYDRPSSKLFGFLRKYFQLEKYFPQPNNFVLFDAFFDSTNATIVRCKSDKKSTQERNSKHT